MATTKVSIYFNSDTSKLKQIATLQNGVVFINLTSPEPSFCVLSSSQKLTFSSGEIKSININYMRKNMSTYCNYCNAQNGAHYSYCNPSKKFSPEWQKKLDEALEYQKDAYDEYKDQEINILKNK